MRRSGQNVAWIALWALCLSACTLGPFEPRIEGDDGGPVTRTDAAQVDARVEDGATGGEGDCTNGADDDGDGDVDCADSDCAAFVCVPEPPDGWEGPAHPSTTGCSSPSEVLLEGGRRLRAEPVTCDPCTCGGASNPRCSATLTAYGDDACTTAVGAVSLDAAGSCTATAAPAESAGNVSTSPTADCAVTSASPPAIADAPAPTFEERLALCWRGAGGGCGAGMRCVAPPPDDAPSCLARDGDVACPAELPSRSLIVRATEDLRGCDDCRCAATGGSCLGTIEAYGAVTCSPIVYVGNVATSGCTDLGTIRGLRYDGATASGVSCGASGGGPLGCVVPSAVSTVCCPTEAGPVCPSGRGPEMVHVGSGASPFCIDATEVTNAQYATFLADGPDPSTQPAPCEDDEDFEPDSGWPPDASEMDLPVVRVDWCDARAFCEWAGKRLCGLFGGGDGDASNERDPAQSEWTQACTAGGAADPSCEDDVAAVRSRPCCQVDGIHDLAGNAEEWTGTCEPAWFGNPRCATHDGRRCGDADTHRLDDDEPQLGFRCCADPL